MASPLDVLLAVPPATIAYWAALLALAAALLVLLLGVLAIAREMIRPAPTVRFCATHLLVALAVYIAYPQSVS